MAVVLKEPKRKHRGYVAATPPFPIFTEQATGIPVCEATWRTYTGRFSGDSVIVDKVEDICALYSMGAFGKGSLSRGCAVLGRLKRNRPTFIKECQWRRHQSWMQLNSLINESETSSAVNAAQENNKGDKKSICDNSRSGNKNLYAANKPGSKESESADPNITVLDDADSECSVIVEVDKSGIAKNGKRKADTECTEQPVKKSNSAVEESEINQSNIEIVDLSSDEDCACSENDKRNCSTSAHTSKPGCSTSTEGAPDNEKTEVVVMSGINSDEEDYLANLKLRLEHEPAHLSQEKLILSLEEAMFLSYGLGCLRIKDTTGEDLSLLQIWKLFQETQRTFVQRYVVYHYFRSKGWVVKSGLKFGGDFVLYKDGPHLYHSSYVVVVQVINERTSARDNARDRRSMSWTQLMGLNRLSEAAGKEVLLCQVVWPAHLRASVLESPENLSSFKVHEILLRRWVPSQERTDHLKNREGIMNTANTVETVCT